MTQPNPSAEEVQKGIQQQAGKLLSQVTGYIGVRNMDMRIRFGLLEEISKHPQGITAETLAANTGMDPFYIGVWCRSAYASELLEQGDNQRYKLAPYVDKLLLDRDFAGYIDGLPAIMLQPEFFDRFAENLSSGERLWWDQCSPTFLQAVSNTGKAFYTRLIPGGLSQVPSLSERLAQGIRVLELACGMGAGLMRLAETFPKSSFVRVDGDEHSLDWWPIISARQDSRTGYP